MKKINFEIEVASNFNGTLSFEAKPNDKQNEIFVTYHFINFSSITLTEFVTFGMGCVGLFGYKVCIISHSKEIEKEFYLYLETKMDKNLPENFINKCIQINGGSADLGDILELKKYLKKLNEKSKPLTEEDL